MDALERDFYEERRRKWRRSAFWRGFAVAAAIGLVLVVAGIASGMGGAGRQIARVEVSGVITEDRDREALLQDLVEAEHVEAVILRINSPGGTTAGSEALYEGVRRIAAEKPVVAVLGEVAASGGYIAAISADHIVARGNTLTGSIGVIMEYPDLSGVLDRLGVEVETLRSSELKAEPSPFRPTSPAARAESQAMIAESYGWFRGLVGDRRGLEGPALDAVATGGVFTGRVALENGLVDELGGEPEALAWLESRRSAVAGLPVHDWEVDLDEPLLSRMLSAVAPSGGILGELSRLAGPKLYSLGP